MKDLKGINAEPDIKDVEDIKCYVGRQARYNVVWLTDHWERRWNIFSADKGILEEVSVLTEYDCLSNI